jgi:hypothetical protein
VVVEPPTVPAVLVEAAGTQVYAGVDPSSQIIQGELPEAEAVEAQSVLEQFVEATATQDFPPQPSEQHLRAPAQLESF